MKTSRFTLILFTCLFVSLVFGGRTMCPGSRASSFDSLFCQQVAANPATSVTALPGQGPKRPLFLWKITASNGHFIYLLGSMHLVPPEVYPLPAELLKIFHQCKSATFEVDQSKLSKDKLRQLIALRGIYEPGDSLNNHISERTKNELAKYMAARELPVENLKNVKPWAISLTVSVLELQRLGLDPELGIDKYFLDEAKAQNKPVYELESAEYQVDLLSGFSEPLQDKFLLQSLIELKDMKTQIGALVSAWKKGDAKAMNNIVVCIDKENPELEPVRKKLLYERNYTMKDSLQEFLKEQSQGFVVVGAAHLVGDKGLLNLFATDGYKVEQVYTTGTATFSQSNGGTLPASPVSSSSTKPKSTQRKPPVVSRSLRNTARRH